MITSYPLVYQIPHTKTRVKDTHPLLLTEASLNIFHKESHKVLLKASCSILQGTHCLHGSEKKGC